LDNRYTVKLYARAYKDLDSIYTYIAEQLLEPNAALHVIDQLEDAILSLEQFPQRGAIRKVGAYAHGQYRQLFVAHYIIVYRIQEESKVVYVVTVRYAPSHF